MANSSKLSNKAPSPVARGVEGLLSRRISIGRAALEACRRGRAAIAARRERTTLDELASQPARLGAAFASLSPSHLVEHFRKTARPLFPGLEATDSTAALQPNAFPDATKQLIDAAERITQEHRWPLLGLGEKDFGSPMEWRRDPLSGRMWPLDYHADIPLWQNDGSDIRVLWELNRLGHFLILGRAFVLTGNEQFAEEFFVQLESWRQQNPLGRGPNWTCAMEVALRAMNLLAAFSFFRQSSSLTTERLAGFLAMLDQHGAHTRRNLEYSYIATSNHYLSDLAGLLWIGIALPELSAADEWRDWALNEMLREMDKQILDDGADYESSTGYHRFVLELFLYSFVLCRAHAIPIPDQYWRKLRAMLVYTRGYLRPDGLAPLVGDSDGGQVLPFVARLSNDHAYLLSIGAVVFNDSYFKVPGLAPSEELLWLLGEKGWQEYQSLKTGFESMPSQAFPDVGTYVLRNDDLFLLCNAGAASHRGSHGHNDALSIEVSAFGCAFIVDPGSYVYTAELHERHLFRSTAYHSTIEVDGVEQNTTKESLPFVIGNEAVSKVLVWETGTEIDLLVGEHAGYERLPDGVRHRRSIKFLKGDRWWLMEDELTGRGEHTIAVRFHFNTGLDITIKSEGIVSARDRATGLQLLVQAIGLSQRPLLEESFCSTHYGAKSQSIAACWTIEGNVPVKLQWALVPVGHGENEEERLKLVQGPTSNVDQAV